MRYSPHVKIISFHCSASIAKYAVGIPTWLPFHPISTKFIETKYLLSHPITSISNKFIQICRDPLKISDIGEQMRVWQDFRASFLSHGLEARFYQLIRSTAPCDSSLHFKSLQIRFCDEISILSLKCSYRDAKRRWTWCLVPLFFLSRHSSLVYMLKGYSWSINNINPTMFRTNIVLSPRKCWFFMRWRQIWREGPKTNPTRFVPISSPDSVHK